MKSNQTRQTKTSPELNYTFACPRCGGKVLEISTQGATNYAILEQVTPAAVTYGRIIRSQHGQIDSVHCKECKYILRINNARVSDAAGIHEWLEYPNRRTP
jgi:transcription elongation factor Elf1